MQRELSEECELLHVRFPYKTQTPSQSVSLLNSDRIQSNLLWVYNDKLKCGPLLATTQSLRISWPMQKFLGEISGPYQQYLPLITLADTPIYTALVPIGRCNHSDLLSWRTEFPETTKKQYMVRRSSRPESNKIQDVFYHQSFVLTCRFPLLSPVFWKLEACCSNKLTAHAPPLP